jgi:L-ascorbate metabolism protein UlaG (beta-lactamase superfamily)
MLVYGNVKLHWLGHDGFVIEGKERTVVIDPFKAKKSYRADLLLISHEHFDHLSKDDIKKFLTEKTEIIAPKICQNELSSFKNKKTFISPGETVKRDDIEVKALPAYNLNKFSQPGRVFHPKEDGRVGFVMKIDGVTIYHAGDTDNIPEIKGLEVDIALLPVSGTYVMTAEEAAEAAKSMKVKVAVPMHWASIVGSREDAEKFKKLLAGVCKVEILEQE